MYLEACGEYGQHATPIIGARSVLPTVRMEPTIEICVLKPRLFLIFFDDESGPVRLLQSSTRRHPLSWLLNDHPRRQLVVANFSKQPIRRVLELRYAPHIDNIRFL